jgi:hypothetical protein
VVSKFSHDQRARIMAESRAHLQRLDAMETIPDDQFRREGTPPPPPEEVPPERGLDTMPVDWAAVIDRRIAAERMFIVEQIGENVGAYVAEQLAEERKAYTALADQFRSMRVELADARADVAQLRLALADQRAGKAALDLPDALGTRRLQ